jgi:hypothetical protein
LPPVSLLSSSLFSVGGVRTNRGCCCCRLRTSSGGSGDKAASATFLVEVGVIFGCVDFDESLDDDLVEHVRDDPFLIPFCCMRCLIADRLLLGGEKHRLIANDLVASLNGCNDESGDDLLDLT